MEEEKEGAAAVLAVTPELKQASTLMANYMITLRRAPHTFSGLNKLWHKGVKVVFVQVCVCLSSTAGLFTPYK